MKIGLHDTLPYSMFGKFRVELMGLAMLNVIVLHSLSWTQLNQPRWVIELLGLFGRLLFTEGFLFLSGYGIYYSFHNDSKLSVFYKKRVKRLLIPYWLISAPFFFTWCFSGEYGITELILRMTTLEFWLQGNFDGMWYIAVSVFLYAIFPILHRGMEKWSFLPFVVIIMAVTIIYHLFPDYYEMTSLGLSKLPFFALGSIAGKFAIERKQFSIWWVVILFALWLILSVYPLCEWLNVKESLFRMFGIVVCTFILSRIVSLGILGKILNWIGRYTLEIYILHMLIYSTLLFTLDGRYARCAIAIGGAFLLCYPVHLCCKHLTEIKYK